MENDTIFDHAGNGWNPALLDPLILCGSSTAAILAMIAVAVSATKLISRLLARQVDPREPHLLQPTIPFVGHLIGMLWHESDYHRIIHEANPSHAAVTLPILNGKVYTVFDPHLIQILLKHKSASFLLPGFHLVKRMFGASTETVQKLISDPELLPKLIQGFHAGFGPEMLQKTSTLYFDGIAPTMTRISCGTATADFKNPGKEMSLSNGIQVENLYLWLRYIMSLASTRALYGDNDPFTRDPSLLEMAWTFEDAAASFLVHPFPSITMAKAHQSREALHRIMKKYYVAGHVDDPSTSQFILQRTNILLEHGFTVEQVGELDTFFTIVATVDVVPTLYWMLLYILDKPELVAQLRIEIEAAAKIAESDTNQRVVSMDVSKMEKSCPLLTSCYRETLRLTTNTVGVRKLSSDILLDGPDGRSFLLKNGTYVQLPVGVAQLKPSIWGDDAAEFVPDRFIPMTQSTAKEMTPEAIKAERDKKAAYAPFGGGKYLCPGRNFAFSETVGFVSMLLLGFDIEPVGMGFSEIESSPHRLMISAVGPKRNGQGLGGRILVRKGWENVQWHVQC